LAGTYQELRMAEGPDKAGRRQDGRFKKGQSGNPGGRPKTLGRVQDLAREYTEKSISILGEIVERLRVRSSD